MPFTAPKSKGGSSSSGFRPPAKSGSGGSSKTPVSIRGGIGALQTSAAKSSQKDWGYRVLGSGPVGAVFNFVSRPAYSVGNLIAGRPGDAAKALAPLLGPVSMGVSKALTGSVSPSFQRTLPGEALQERGVIPGGAVGAGLRFGADVALDPLTYATFGAGTGANLGRTAAMKAASEAVAAAARSGKVGLPLVAESAVQVAKAPRARVLSVGVRLPGTRGKSLTFARSTRGGAALGKVLDKASESGVGRQLREFALPQGASDKGIHDVYQAVRRAGEVEKHRISRDARRLEKDLASAEKSLGLGKGEGARAITRHLDDPNNHLPVGLQAFSDKARSLLDEFHTQEVGAGIDKRLVESYVPHLPATQRDRELYQQMFQRGPAEPFFVKPRALQSLADWDRHGLRPEESISRLVEVRGHASVDERVRKAFDDAVAGGFGKTPAEVKKAEPQAALLWRDAPGKYMEGKQLPPDVAQAVNRVHQRITPNVTGDGLEATRRFIGQTTASWKALALLSPGYHLRNMYSDLMAAYWAGARNPRSFVQAGLALAGKGGETIKVGKTRMGRNEFLSLAEAHGVVNSGFARHEVERGIDAYKTGVSGLNRPGRGRLARGSQEVGQAREDSVRLGLFLERLKAGDSSTEAALRVREYLFDYGDVGRFVESARRFWAPFITYPSKAIPMVAKTFASRPGIPANLSKLQEESNQSAGVDTSLLPVGSRLSLAVPLPGGVKKAIGAPADQPLLFNPEQTLPYGSLQVIDPRQPGRYLGGLASPFARAGVELATDHSFYTGRNFAKLVKAPAAIVAAKGLGFPIPGYGQKQDVYTKKQVPGYSPKLDTLLRLFPPFGQSGYLIPGGGTEAERLQRVRFGSGFSLNPYDRGRAQYYANRYGGK